MKIAFVYTSPFPAKRGFSAADRRVRDLIRGLQFSGIEVSLFIPQYHKELSLEHHNEDFEIYYIGNTKSKAPKWYGRFKFWKALYKIVLSKGYDTVFLYNTQIDSLHFIKKVRKKGIKVVYEICDYHSFSEKVSVKTTLATLAEKNIPKNTDLLITISDFLENLIKKNFHNANILKIPILVDSEYFQDISNVDTSKYKGDYFLISYVGGVWHHQGVGVLMKAFKRVNELRPKTKLLIAGNYDSLAPNKTNILELAKELEILDNLILPGWVDTESVRSILYASDLLVISQTNDLFTQAGLPTKLAEYTVCRKPVLATTVGDVPLYFKDKFNALLCEPSDIESMVNAILYAVDNPNEMKKISSFAYETANAYFDYKSNGNQIFNKLKSL